MSKIRIDGTDVLGGLEWTVIHSPQTEVAEKKALSQFRSTHKNARRGIIIKANGTTVVGVPEDQKNIPKKTPSAAGLLALANQVAIEASHTEGGLGGLDTPTSNQETNWICVEKIEGEDDLYWMGVIFNGTPAPGGDIIASQDNIITEILGFVSAAAQSYVVFTNDENVRYNVMGDCRVVEKSFSEIVQGIPTKPVIPTLFSVGTIIAVSLVAGVLLVFGSWFAYDTWLQNHRQEQARLASLAQQEGQRQQMAQETKQYEAQIRTVMLEGLKKGMQQVEVALGAPSPQEAVAGWTNILYQVDLNQSTWDLRGFECALEDTTPVCSVSLNRGTFGVNRYLLDDRPDATVEGDNASYVLRGTPLSLRAPSLNTVSSSLDFNKGVLSDMQEIRRSGIQHTVGASQEVIEAVPIPPPPALLAAASATVNAATGAPQQTAQATASIQLGFANGSFELRGEELWQISGVASYLELPNIRARDLTIVVNPSNINKSNWVLRLDYLVRTLPQPVLPPIPAGDKQIVIELPEEYRSEVEVTGGMSESGVMDTSEQSAEVSEEQPTPSGDLETDPVDGNITP